VSRHQPFAIGENHRALNRILQLAHIARPRMRDEHREGFTRQRHLLANVAGDPLDEVMRQLRNVLLPIA